MGTHIRQRIFYDFAAVCYLWLHKSSIMHNKIIRHSLSIIPPVSSNPRFRPWKGTRMSRIWGGGGHKGETFVNNTRKIHQSTLFVNKKRHEQVGALRPAWTWKSKEKWFVACWCFIKTVRVTEPFKLHYKPCILLCWCGGSKRQRDQILKIEL
jgi:hypothetical protein